jgi:SNF2 family DNA or RNA helicase
MIFIDTPWTAAVFNQACDRIYRIGTKNKVFIYNLITKDTIDERVLEIINDKKAIADYIIDNEISKSTIDNLRKYILELK